MNEEQGTMPGRCYASLSDAEFLTMVEALPVFQGAGSAAWECFLRLAVRVGHPAGDNDAARMVRPKGQGVRYRNNSQTR